MISTQGAMQTCLLRILLCGPPAGWSTNDNCQLYAALAQFDTVLAQWQCLVFASLVCLVHLDVFLQMTSDVNVGFNGEATCHWMPLDATGRLLNSWHLWTWMRIRFSPQRRVLDGSGSLSC